MRIWYPGTEQHYRLATWTDGAMTIWSKLNRETASGTREYRLFQLPKIDPTAPLSVVSELLAARVASELNMERQKQHRSNSKADGENPGSEVTDPGTKCP